MSDEQKPAEEKKEAPQATEVKQDVSPAEEKAEVEVPAKFQSLVSELKNERFGFS